MKAIDLTAALIAANNINLNGADALIETRALRQLIESCNARIDELKSEAKALAKQHLDALGIDSGRFQHLGYTFEGQLDVTYDFVGKPQKYTMKEGVAYRQKIAEQKVLKSQSSAITKALKAIRDAFPSLHPTIDADNTDLTVKCID